MHNHLNAIKTITDYLQQYCLFSQLLFAYTVFLN